MGWQLEKEVEKACFQISDKQSQNLVLAIKIPSDNIAITCKAKQRLFFLLHNLAIGSSLPSLIYSVFFPPNCWKLLVSRWCFACGFCDLYANYMIPNANVNKIYVFPGRLGGTVGLIIGLLVSAQVLVSGSWDWAPPSAPCSVEFF